MRNEQILVGWEVDPDVEGSHNLRPVYASLETLVKRTGLPDSPAGGMEKALMTKDSELEKRARQIYYAGKAADDVPWKRLSRDVKFALRETARAQMIASGELEYVPLHAQIQARAIELYEAAHGAKGWKWAHVPHPDKVYWIREARDLLIGEHLINLPVYAVQDDDSSSVRLLAFEGNEIGGTQTIANETADGVPFNAAVQLSGTWKTEGLDPDHVIRVQNTHILDAETMKPLEGTIEYTRIEPESDVKKLDEKTAYDIGKAAYEFFIYRESIVHNFYRGLFGLDNEEPVEDVHLIHHEGGVWCGVALRVGTSGVWGLADATCETCKTAWRAEDKRRFSTGNNGEEAAPEAPDSQPIPSHCSTRSRHEPHDFEAQQQDIGGEGWSGESWITYSCDGSPGGFEKDRWRS